MENMNKLNDAEQLLVDQILLARKAVEPKSGELHEDGEIRNFALLQLINHFRNIYTNMLNPGIDPREIAAALDIPAHMVDENGVIKLGEVLAEWFGAEHALAFINFLAELPLPKYPAEIEFETKNTLNPAIPINVQTEQRDRGKKQGAGEPGGKRREMREATIKEVLANLMLAFNYAGVALTEENHAHYALNDPAETHVIDLRSHNIRIVVTNKLSGKSHNTYVIKTDTSQSLESLTNITPDHWESYPQAKAIKKYENHAIKIAQAVKRFILGEDYDGCVNIEGTQASDCTSINDRLTRMCDRHHLSKALSAKGVVPIIHYNSPNCADVYSKDDILKAVAEIFGYSSIEELERLQIVETDEKGIAEVKTDREKIKVISLLYLGEKMGFARKNALTDYVENAGIKPFKYIKGISRSGRFIKVDLYPYDEAIQALKEKMFGMDPFETEVVKTDWQTATLELDGIVYVIPEVDLFNKVDNSGRRSALRKQFHESNAERHREKTLALIRPRGFMRLYPLDDTYRKFMQDNSLAS